MTERMTEDDYLVKVRAQVMTRDESTEGWLPLAGGGLANVSIRKRARLPPDVGGHEYIIYGQRISDQTVILSCVINRDLQYFKVMPTFHHWRAGKQRNGLTFQTAADARAFDKGIIRAYDDLIDGLNPNWSSPYKYGNQVGEDDVFMTLDLPIEPSESRSSSEASGSQKNSDKQQIIHIISSEKTPQPTPSLSNTNNTEQPNATIVPGDNYSYVQLTAVHEYNYPVVDEPVGAVMNARRGSTCSLKKRSALDMAEQHIIKEPTIHKSRVRCRYCQEFYTEEWNGKAAYCEFAPDCFKNGLEQISGMMCARCMLYHCMSDAEGDTTQHPCECVCENGCTRRWIGLALLSLLVPCLCFYPPLRACHLLGISCGICGGRHHK
ncbi:sprouty-related, EVH1 domain-containing protein 1 isoform X1 [Bradysia coprophila]|uniref:sprouty-related, EVH1 domain-containing protein 1 isoform X1 n=1 Tax=Bradysia coprophila TaxID=38358 RepID=UPI00187D9C5B|nr:sprouty-related, EVH1 domain-containing protein 1 isoform X1 [Bradysia coprophila]